MLVRIWVTVIVCLFCSIGVDWFVEGVLWHQPPSNLTTGLLAVLGVTVFTGIVVGIWYDKL